MGFFRFALAVLVVRSDTTTPPPEKELGNCQTFMYHFGEEKGKKLWECPEDKPVPKDLVPTPNDKKPIIVAMVKGAKVGDEEYVAAAREVCCPASMVGFAVFSLLL